MDRIRLFFGVSGSVVMLETSISLSLEGFGTRILRGIKRVFLLWLFEAS